MDILPAMEFLIGIAAVDDKFRDWLFMEPEEAARSVGIALPKEGAEYVRSIAASERKELEDALDLLRVRADVAWSGIIFQPGSNLPGAGPTARGPAGQP